MGFVAVVLGSNAELAKARLDSVKLSNLHSFSLAMRGRGCGIIRGLCPALVGNQGTLSKENTNEAGNSSRIR